MDETGLIERNALGRPGSIGSLYNIRTDQFEPGNLFKTELPSSFMESIDDVNVSYVLDFHNSQRETFNNLDIEANLKLGLMAGRLHIEGKAEYLKHIKTDSKTVRTTFICKIKTKREDLLLSSEGLQKYFSPNAFENANVTHAVIGIKWGANVAATFERHVENNDDVTRIEGTLAANYKKLQYGRGPNSGDNDDQARKDMESLNINFSGDVMIPNCPQTIEQVLEFYREVPSLLTKLNDGKGKPVTFILCSIEQIAEITNFKQEINRLIHDVSEGMIDRIEEIFEEMNEERRKLNDFFEDIKPWKDYIARSWLKTIENQLVHFRTEELKLKHDLYDLLVKVRKGTAEESQMLELINNFDANPCSPTSTENFLEGNKRIQIKIKTLTRISSEKKELIKTISSIEDFLEDFEQDEVYLLHICEQWEHEEQENSAKQRRFFINLKRTEHDARNTKAKFWVIDHDLHPKLNNKPTNSVIYYATNGEIKSRDFRKDSFHKLSRKQIDLILRENSNITESWLINRHKRFLYDHPDAEISENDFIDEFQRLFPKGNPSQFCEFTFSVIDKNRNGKIDFVEFMSAVALTLPGNRETRLRLVFSVCDYDCSRTINARKIVKFIEVIAELNGGSSAVNTNAARSVAEQIMNMCSQKQDGAVTEQEFIDCCKQNDDIAMRFFPDEKMLSDFKALRMQLSNLNLNINQTWKQHATMTAAGHGQGDQLNQLWNPDGVHIDDDQTIYVADTSNHRIVEWKSDTNNGRIVAGQHGHGNRNDQLSYPTEVIVDKQTDSLIICDAGNRRIVRWPRRNGQCGEILISHIDCWDMIMDNDGYLYVSDIKKNEVRRWKIGETSGTIVAGGNGQGDRPNQLNYPLYIFIDEDHSVYVSDCNNHRVVKWLKDAKEGIIVAGGQRQGNSLKQLSDPHGIMVDQFGSVYVVDRGNGRVMRWLKGAREGTIVVGGNGQGDRSDQLNGPVDLSFDRQKNLYIVDRDNHRVQKFDVDFSKN